MVQTSFLFRNRGIFSFNCIVANVGFTSTSIFIILEVFGVELCGEFLSSGSGVVLPGH